MSLYMYYKKILKPTCPKKGCNNRMNRTSEWKWKYLWNREDYYIIYSCDKCGTTKKFHEIESG